MSLKDLNDITVATYHNNFQKYKDTTTSTVTGEVKAWLDSFASLLPEKGSIIELGSATGRDARYLSSLGYTLMCTDVIKSAVKELAEEGFETSLYDFRDVPEEGWRHRYDGYIANAVLLHAPSHIFEQALRYVHVILKKGGIAMIVLKEGVGQEMTIDKIGAPRYFKYHNEESLKTTLAKMPFEVIEITHSFPKKWIKVLMRAL